MSGIFSLSKYLPRASPRHVQPCDSEKGAEDYGLDVMLVYPESKESAEDWPAKFRAITKSNVYSFRMRPKALYPEKDFENSSEEDTDLPTDPKPEGAYDRSSTRLVVFVAETPEARTVYDEVRLPEPIVLDHMRRRIPFAGRVYGVIELRRKSNLGFTCMLTWGQWGLHNIVKNYYGCRHSTDMCQSAKQPRIVTNPSIGMVIFVTIMSMLDYWMQYDLNRGDRYQRLCLLTGIAVAFFVSFLLSQSGPSIKSIVTLMVAMNLAMTCSALGHLIWRKYFSTCERRLEMKLDEWKEEARRIQVYSQKDLKLECEAQKPHVMKFHELD
ncbi:hypothetical protein J4E93_005404 [Alternaria ventricosa]|uniref:uncharacterized protein n=1 Tax=Alternaria ventricosa TaxID=1187951 RepID=UPI0020C1C898|nr:uncharacterized protein J4E93_005404 [Alternaria ventricosa]KAI4645826.1 hypothetical protein J4E93_005404 [Alternaria ventricosa]